MKVSEKKHTETTMLEGYMSNPIIIKHNYELKICEGFSITQEKQPNIIHRFFQRVFFGFKWTAIAFILFNTLTAFSQDTTYTIKTINKDRQITGYLIVSVLNNKVIKTERLCCYSGIERLNLRKNAKAKVYLNEVPRDYLKEDEYLKNGVRDNEL